MVDTIIHSVLALLAIWGIVRIEMEALRRGINGKALSFSIACIAGLGGVFIGKILGG